MAFSTRGIMYLIVAVILLGGYCTEATPDERNTSCLQTESGQKEMQQILQEELIKGAFILPTDENGSVLCDNLWKKFHPGNAPYNRHHRRSTRRECDNSRFCTPKFWEEMDRNRLPVFIRRATCVDCGRCHAAGGTCRPITYNVSVLRRRNGRSLPGTAVYETYIEKVPVDCICDLGHQQD